MPREFPAMLSGSGEGVMATTTMPMDVGHGDSILETDILTRDEEAEAQKEEGNKEYKNKNYKEALRHYTKAIELCPDTASFYANRAACHLMLGHYELALDDSRAATRLDAGFVKAFLREARCHIALGDAGSALRALDSARLLEPSNVLIDKECSNVKQLVHFEDEANKAFEKKDYRKVVYCMDRAMTQAVVCSRFKLMKAECLALLGRYMEAQEIANDLLQRDAINADAMYVRGVTFYYQDNIEKAFAHFQKVLRLAPDHHKTQEIYRRAKQLKAKKDAGNEAFKTGRLQEAYKLYSDALEIDPHNIITNAKLYFNRATVCFKTNKLNQAVNDCNKAIELDESYVKAYLRRAKCYTALEMYEEAVRDCEKAFKLDKCPEHKQLLQDAQLELKKSKRKDYYKILGIERCASDDEIRKAYRKRALVHHPDRHANASDEMKHEQEKKFKEVGEAYGVLSDPKKRTRYDNGHDLEDMEGFSGKDYSDIDPSNIFQAFFSGPGNFQFATGPNVNGSFSSNFPGGFAFQFS